VCQFIVIKRALHQKNSCAVTSVQSYREYDFVNFNSNNGHVIVNTLLSPALNNMGPDEPLGIGIQLDDQSPVAQYYIPPAPPGAVPPTWDGNDGYIANAIINVPTNWTLSSGQHTLKVCLLS
jgi:hypothetical protein